MYNLKVTTLTLCNNGIICNFTILISYNLSRKEITHFAKWPVDKRNVKEISFEIIESKISSTTQV